MVQNKKWQWIHFLLGLGIITSLALIVFKISGLLNDFSRIANSGASISVSGYLILESAPMLLLTAFCSVAFILVDRHNKKKDIAPLLIRKGVLLRFMPVWMRIVCGVVCLVVFFSLTVYEIQDLFVYSPSKYGGYIKKVLQNSEISEVSIEDGKYYGLLYSTGSDKVILFFGGNAQESAQFFNTFYDKKYNEKIQNSDILFIDYPGYGKSEGRPCEQGIYEMAVCEYTYAKEHYSEIEVVGYSLGTGVASFVASSHEIENILLIAPYSSMTDVYNSYLPVFLGPGKFLVKNKYPNDQYAEKIVGDVTIVASADDEVIPYKLSEKLCKSSDNMKMITLSDLSHGELVFCEEAWEIIQEMSY